MVLKTLFLLGLIFVSITAPPPNRQKAEQQAPPQEQHDENQKPQYEFAYSKYLEKVIKILETDPKFQERIKKMDEKDIKEGKIADHIDDLNQEVFDELTKAKLQELERLREQIDEDIKRHGDPSKVPVPEHIDVYNWEKFNKEDLRKLITKTVSHMEEIDKQRREQFKEYEMKKKAEEDHNLAQMRPDEREKEKHKIEEAKERHNNHEKLKHPGDREQLEEVWEESDHMDKDGYDPRTFFNLHDLNGDGFWNDEEVEALFQVELSKLYNESNPDDDPREKVEEMYRMREHVVNQMDKNKDRLISLEEFLQDTEAVQDDNKDDGWKDLGQQQVYTDEELKKFEEDYARQQGWGEHAYDPFMETPPHLDAQVQNNQVHDQANTHNNPPPPPPPVQGHPNQAQVPQQPPQASVAGQAHKAVDPHYGV